jgi:hypothetical protein
MRDIDKLNALTNPIGYVEEVTLAGNVYTVNQNMLGLWFLRRPISTGFEDICHAHGQVDFIANVLTYRDLTEEIPNERPEI